jgi:beta-glucanase (GH16 family)
VSKKPPPWRERGGVRVMALITAAVLLLTVDPAALVKAAAADLESASPSLSEPDRQRVRLQVLPGLRQPGARVSSSDRALSALKVAVRPAVAGRRIVLQYQVGDQWRRTGTAMTDENGRATIFVPPRSGSFYRAVAKSHRGLDPTRSASVPADIWGDPDFVDEFDGTTLSDAWEHRIQFYNPWGGRSCSKGSPAAVRVSNGALRLSSMVDPAATSPCTPTDADGTYLGGSYPYRLNGHISTQHSVDFLYGVAAARMRFPKSIGQHAAFWLQPRGLLETGPTPWGAEIDVVEWYGHGGTRSRLASTVHAPMPDGQKRQLGGPIPRPGRFLSDRTDTWWTRFHVFSVEWTPTEYIFRISGREVWRTSEGVSDVPEFLILSMLSSDFELPTLGSRQALAQTASVDWVKFWQAD